LGYLKNFKQGSLAVLITLVSAWVWLAMPTISYAQTPASLIWENQGHTDQDAIPPTTQYTSGGSTLTVDWSLTTSGGTIIPYSGDDFVSYGGSTRGNTFGNLEVGFDNDANDPNDFFTLELTFNKIVEDLQFSVLDIDRGGIYWHDVVEIYYDDGTGFSNVSLDASIWTLGGNKVALDNETYAEGWEGTGVNAGSTDPTANIDLDFTGKDVIALRFVYFSGDDSQANPNGQVSGISDMTWTVPPAGPEDHSDAPLTGTLYGNAIHPIVAGIQLGATNTAETSGYNSPTATGDADDGISMPSFTAGETSTIVAAVSGVGGYLQGWIDWNDDGDWNDANERIATDLQDTDANGQILIPVAVPGFAALSETIARFRWSTASGINNTVAVTDGEVEDYALTVEPALATPTCPAGYNLVAQPGNAATVIVSAINSTRALGAISPEGTNASPVSATNNNSNPTLTLELEHIVAEGAPITFSLARNNAGGNSNLDTSVDNSVYVTQNVFNGGIEEVLNRYTAISPAGGTKFVRIQRNSGSVRIDGIYYDQTCISTNPDLQADKTVAVYDPTSAGLYALPGNDVIYTLAISNAGNGAADADSIELIDHMPSDIEFWNGDIDAGGGSAYPGSDPVGFLQPAGTGMSLTYGTDIRFGTGATAPADFSACTVVAPDNTYRPDLTYICFNPKGTLAVGDPDPAITLAFRARIK